ncbi:hypothetical protein JL722_2285 [Aureococcus anophagefferens]|nr:hypothetical protein JL722_2285 [Aureococcus anophagefferens]
MTQAQDCSGACLALASLCGETTASAASSRRRDAARARGACAAPGRRRASQARAVDAAARPRATTTSRDAAALRRLRRRPRRRAPATTAARDPRRAPAPAVLEPRGRRLRDAGRRPGLADKDYKVAYLKQAKVWHPDLRPGDPEATRKFQELSAAYEQIKDQRLRAAYDAPDLGRRRAASGPSANRSAQEAAATWAEAYDDAGALFEAGRAWWSDECAALDDDAPTAMARRSAPAARGHRPAAQRPHRRRRRAPGHLAALARRRARRDPRRGAARDGGAPPRASSCRTRAVPVFTGLIRQFGGRYWTAAVNRARAKLRERDARKAATPRGRRTRTARSEARRAYARTSTIGGAGGK